MEFKAIEIAAFLKGEIEGDGNVIVNNVSKIEEGKAGTLAFLANPKYLLISSTDLFSISSTFLIFSLFRIISFALYHQCDTNSKSQDFFGSRFLNVIFGALYY